MNPSDLNPRKDLRFRFTGSDAVLIISSYGGNVSFRDANDPPARPRFGRRMTLVEWKQRVTDGVIVVEGER